MCIIYKKIALLLAALSFASISNAMEEKKIPTHVPPVLSLGLQGNKATIAIASPQVWRENNTYLNNKTGLEEAIINQPQITVSFTSKSRASLFSANKFNRREWENFFTGTNAQQILKNHYALMSECNARHCPLSRSVKNRGRTNFENALLERFKSQHDMEKPIRYVGFASGLSSLSDLRIIMMLKKSGYKFEKIQFIDLKAQFLIDNLFKPNASQTFFNLELSQNTNELADLFELDEVLFTCLADMYSFAQFLGILANYDGDDIIEYYAKVEDYIRDLDNSPEKADLIVAVDYLEQDCLQESTKIIIREFENLKTHNKYAMLGSLYVDYKPFSRASQIISGISSSCKTCNERMTKIYNCTCQKASYCSEACQKKDWPTHKALYHIKPKR